jgi:hypothetical protein
MKKTEIAAKVFEAMDAVPLSALAGGAVKIPIADLAGLALVPWFCDVSVQWALRLAIPGKTLTKSLLKKVNGSFVSVDERGALLVGVPGDGIEPSTFVLLPLVEAVAHAAQPGMKLELATANLGIVKRDWDAKAETDTPFGNQRYLGTIDADGLWAITQTTTPGLAASTLADALACGRMVARNGPWTVSDKAEAHAIVMHWLRSPEANVNPMAVQRFITLKDGAFTNRDPGMTRKLCGLGLGFFRHRLGGSPFRWPAPGPTMHAVQQLEDVARVVVG